MLDMAGNVLEWTRSLLGKYPYPSGVKERAQREDLQAPHNTRRVLRGGAFSNLHGSVRGAYRSWNLPDGRGGIIGFRVVVLPS
jgi:formylglycine-generating enzyme required for sulfatase activity